MILTVDWMDFIKQHVLIVHMIVNRNEFVRLTRISGICTWVYKTVELIFWHWFVQGVWLFRGVIKVRDASYCMIHTCHRFGTVKYSYRTPTILWHVSEESDKLKPFTTHPTVPIGVPKCCTHNGKTLVKEPCQGDGPGTVEKLAKLNGSEPRAFFVRCIFKYMHEFMLA